METCREEKFFSFSPESIIQSIITSFYDKSNEIIESMKEYFSELSKQQPDSINKESVIKSVNEFHKHLQEQIARETDIFEMYLMSNVFKIPSDGIIALSPSDIDKNITEELEKEFYQFLEVNSNESYIKDLNEREIEIRKKVYVNEKIKNQIIKNDKYIEILKRIYISMEKIEDTINKNVLCKNLDDILKNTENAYKILKELKENYIPGPI